MIVRVFPLPEIPKQHHPISMSISISSILETHPLLLKERQGEVQFEIDLQGKRILHKKTSRFYIKRRLTKGEIVDVVVTSFVVIEKMSKLKRCLWTMTELCELLYNGIKYYENYFKIDISELLNNETDRTKEVKNDLNEKFPGTCKFKTIDGHYVRSEAEQTIDNFLFRNGVIHAYEKRLPGDKSYYCDFYIPPGDKMTQPIYIEYWGMENDASYFETMKKKLEIYKREQLQLIEVTKTNLINLKGYLTEKFRLFNLVLE
jgi:hypothetical protein